MRTMKKVLAIVLMAAVVVCCTACGGLDMSKVKGNWTLETAAGKTVEEIAAANGVDIASVTMNATVTDDSFTLSSVTGSETYKIQVRANGFECLDDSKNVVMGVIYDSAKDTLTFQLKQADGSVMDCVMKKGTADLTVTTAPADSTGSTAEAGSGSTAEAGSYSYEEYYTGEAE